MKNVTCATGGAPTQPDVTLHTRRNDTPTALNQGLAAGVFGSCCCAAARAATQ